MKDRIERFDDTFKLLLTIETVLVAFSFAFLKDIIESRFYSVTVFTYILLVIFWSVTNIVGGLRPARDYEYFMKVFLWYLLVFLLLLTFFRLSSKTFDIDLEWGFISLCFSLGVSFPFTIYLKEYMPFTTRKIVCTFLIVGIMSFCLLLMVLH